MNAQPIISAIPLSFIDFHSVESSVGFSMPADPEEAIFGVVCHIVESAGGSAVVEVDRDGLFCVWAPPGSLEDARQILYASHMLQSGLNVYPTEAIANTAYSGSGITLARSIVAINAFNPYVAERDSGLLARAMPFSPQAWLAHGIVLMENMRFKEAAAALGEAAGLDPDGILTLKCLTICLTIGSPKKAVLVAEDMLRALSRVGEPPDVHARAAYGFALIAAGMRKDAELQFDAGFGIGLPAMTPRQWRDWGNRIPIDGLKAALIDPKPFAPRKEG